jgi:hypothetical protein
MGAFHCSPEHEVAKFSEVGAKANLDAVSSDDDEGGHGHGTK